MKHFLAAFVLVATVQANEQRFVFERGLMGTRFAITCHGIDQTEAKAAADAAFSVAEEINAVASDYIAGSELLQLSENTGKLVKVSPRLFDLLVQSLAVARLTDGRFDPTLGPLTKQWRETRRTGKLPAPDALATLKSACGWNLLALDLAEKTVTLTHPNMRLDLGGIAKGYAADAMFQVMKSKGFATTCIAAGGDLRLGDPPPGAKGWLVGLTTLEKTKTTGHLELSNCGISTSGDLQQSVAIAGISYAHIIDPQTGLGLTTHLAVTIVAADATTSDALATAACVAGPAEAERLAISWGAREVRVALPGK